MLNINNLTTAINNAALQNLAIDLNQCLFKDYDDDTPIIAFDQDLNRVSNTQLIAMTLDQMHLTGNRDTYYISVAKQINGTAPEFYLEPATNYQGEDVNPIYLPLNLNFKVAFILI